MLEVKDLYKVYKPKKGVPVEAINHVSLKFPETGMVFLLGKSGSGKSTMLNLLGGLDSYDGGEIIIKGVSSKQFKQQHFDSYRNTYVGFIFQEYNILEEFTVGANVALALELQGRKATDEEINRILKEVDLEGYGNRKPNELSGGQKQRVAIARALVKNPEIIMADEPTGALDSVTGKAVFDTLKKLSEDKLVIIVSHDREFSEQYADRIIELADGKVISDVELADRTTDEENAKELKKIPNKEEGRESEETPDREEVTGEPSLVFKENTIEIASGYHLTEEDREAINRYMDSRSTGESLVLARRMERGKGRNFIATDENKITRQDGSAFRLIKSKLPMKTAFRIGASGLKYKKFRLIMTILLSCVAFTLFGLSDIFAAYNHTTTCAQSIVDSGVKYASFDKSVKHYWGEEEDDYSWYYGRYYLTEDEKALVEKETGISTVGVVASNMETDQYDPETTLSKNGMYSTYSSSFCGFAEISEDTLKELGCKLVAGSLPDGSKNEIAISSYMCRLYKTAKYTADYQKYETIAEDADMVGRTLTLGGVTYTVTGIIDTNYEEDRYASVDESLEGKTTAEKLVVYALSQELDYVREYSLATVAMVGQGFLQTYLDKQLSVSVIDNRYQDFCLEGDMMGASVEYITTLDQVKEAGLDVVWLNGQEDSLGDKDIIVTEDSLYYFEEDGGLTEDNNAVSLSYYLRGDDSYTTLEGYHIVGYLPNDGKEYNWEGLGTIVLADSCYEKYNSGEQGIYSFVMGQMPDTTLAVMPLVAFSSMEYGDVRYDLMNAVSYELDTIHPVIKPVSKVFLYVGIGFAIFAALMLSNFIAQSISYKKQEIGILRAIGSRSNDVFRIFFSESFIIAMINFVIALASTFGITSLINYFVRERTGLLITIFHFGIRQVGLLLLVSLLVAFIASFFPVKRIASKKPIDAIRNR